MTALSHAHRFPNARATTLARLIVQERKTEQLMAEVDARVNAALVSHLAEILPEFGRADNEDSILHFLIPRAEGGLGNAKCRMFKAAQSASQTEVA